MPNRSEQKSLLIILSVFSFVVVGTYAVTLIARGYRPSLQPGGLTLNATGLLSATSVPKSASVYINNNLITATDDTINLSPGNYLVKIVKDGYFAWQKYLTIKKEIVNQTDAQLFRSSPDLKPLTQTGAINPTVSPDYSKIIYSVASASASKDNGLYIIELANNILYLNKNTPQQIAPNYPGIDWSKATFTFSPNGLEVLAHITSTNSTYLLNINSPLNLKNITEVTPKLPIISKEWSTQEQILVSAKISRLPVEIQAIIATDSAQKISFSPNDKKVLYMANSDSNLPDQILPPSPAQSSQKQTRNLHKNSYYIYDLKEDTNFYIGEPNTISLPFWLQNSDNLIYVEKSNIISIDSDSTNKLTLFAGNILPQNVCPMADGTKIIVLTAAYTGSNENLYAVTIR